MDAKEAQDRTERRWLAIINDDDDDDRLPTCGWCIFTGRRLTPNEPLCHNCPVAHIFGVACSGVPEYREWVECNHEDPDLARKVYDLLIAHREQLIAVGEEIDGKDTG